MERFVDLKIGDMHFVQQNKYSKISVTFDDGKKITANTKEELPIELYEILDDILKIKENPKDYLDIKYLDFMNSFLINGVTKRTIKNISLPLEIDGKPVVIAESAFEKVPYVENIFIPEGYKYLSSCMCEEMPDLKRVYLPSTISSIEYSAFKNCKNLEKINLENITFVSKNSFENCKKLSNIDLKNTEIIIDRAFINCESLDSIDASNATAIGLGAFAGCKNLKKVILNNEVSELEPAIFANCEKLEEINLPKKLTLIDNGVFSKCKALKKIVLPKALKRINYRAFINTNIEGTIEFPVKLKKIGHEAFKNTKINEIKLSNNTKFEQDAFPLDGLINMKFYENKEKQVTTEEISR